MKNNNNIILIGLMGAGKSSIGTQLADRLSMQFVDTDEFIEKKLGKTVNEIFEIDGEVFFRKLEAQILQEEDFMNHVIATGGGMPVFGDNMEQLNKLGTTIYLRISEDKLAERLWMVRKKRPLLRDIKSIKDLSSFLEQQLNIREKFYEKAHYVLNINDKASCEILEDLCIIVDKLKKTSH